MRKRKIGLYLKLFMAGLFCLGLTYCAKEKSGANTPPEKVKDLAVEISQEKQRIQVSENLNKAENIEFSQGDYLKSLPASMLKMRLKSGEADSTDTIKSADQIPVVRQDVISQNVYTDGSFVYTSEDKTPADMLFIENMDLNPQTVAEKVVKTVVQDGVATLYNANGDVLRTEPVGQMDLKPMLDSMNQYLASPQQKSTSEKRNKALSIATKSGMKLKSQSATEVVMEVDMGMSPSVLPGKRKSLVVKKSVLKFSPDMSQMYSQKVYEGNQLIQSVEMEFAKDTDSKLKNTSPSAVSSLFPTANVKMVKRKTLVFTEAGTPMIQNYVENYTKNQIIYHKSKK